MRLVSSFLIITSFVFFVFSFAACGRRGDPVPIAPYDENIVQEDVDVEKDQDRIPVEEGVNRESGVLMPDAPVGLMALYTQTAVVLIWDDVKGQEVKRYNIYRSCLIFYKTPPRNVRAINYYRNSNWHQCLW